MNNSAKWKLFITWWNEYRFNCKEIEADIVLREINNYIKRLKQGEVKEK